MKKKKILLTELIENIRMVNNFELTI